MYVFVCQPLKQSGNYLSESTLGTNMKIITIVKLIQYIWHHQHELTRKFPRHEADNQRLDGIMSAEWTELVFKILGVVCCIYFGLQT